MDKLTIGSRIGWSDKATNADDSHYCVVCGRKTGKNAYLVHLDIYGEVLPLDSDSEESQGCWSVGSECAKKFDASVIEKVVAA
jgi:hypothetical protein